MSTTDVQPRTMRVGVFSAFQNADRAVARLLEAGFTPEHLTVVCSGETQENYFRDYAKNHPTEHVKGEITSGATVGAAVAGLSAIALGVVSGGAVPLVVAGLSGAAAGGATGAFLGVMTSQEVENDFLNACHEEVLAGKILVSAEDTSDEHSTKLAQASRIFKEEGSELNTLPQP